MTKKEKAKLVEISNFLADNITGIIRLKDFMTGTSIKKDPENFNHIAELVQSLVEMSLEAKGLKLARILMNNGSRTKK